MDKTDSTQRWGQRFSKCQAIVTREIAGETILVPIEGNLANLEQIYFLDDVSDFIWQRLDGQTPLAEIRDQVVAAFTVDEQVAATDLLAFIDELSEAGLIE